MRKVNVELLKVNLAKLHVQANTYEERLAGLSEQATLVKSKVQAKHAEIEALQSRIEALTAIAGTQTISESETA